jgi:CheY-like chemotaxis protein
LDEPAGLERRLIPPMRILIVEDDGLVAMMLEDMIADLGFEVAFSTGKLSEAIAWLDGGGQADAALLDVDVAGEPVFPLAERLARRSTPFAFATGHSQVADPRFRDAPILGKPISLERLEQTFRKLGLFGDS